MNTTSAKESTILISSVLFFRLKIFVPIAFLAWAVLVPVNWTSEGLERAGINNVTSSDIDKLSISNVESRSQRFQYYFIAAAS